jgi:alkylhydroperoxidase family enzyme
MAFYESVMHAPGDLSRIRREMIAVVVSGLNRCHY